MAPCTKHIFLSQTINISRKVENRKRKSWHDSRHMHMLWNFVSCKIFIFISRHLTLKQAPTAHHIHKHRNLKHTQQKLLWTWISIFNKRHNTKNCTNWSEVWSNRDKSLNFFFCSFRCDIWVARTRFKHLFFGLIFFFFRFAIVFLVSIYLFELKLWCHYFSFSVYGNFNP